MTNIHARAQHGTSLIEVIVAIGLLAVFACTMFVSMSGQLLSSVGTRQSFEALSLAQEGLEAARAIRDSSFASLATGTHGLAYANTVWSFQNTSDTTAGYTRTVSVTDLSASERAVVSTVSWIGRTNTVRSVSLETTITNWRNAADVRLSGNWKNPQTLASFDLGPGNQATGVAVKNNAVYMTAIASSASKPDFFVINTQDLAHPSLAASLNTGPGTNALVVEGDFAYVANNDESHQLQIINISATTTPYVVSSFALAGNDQEALSIAVTGTLAIIGTKNGSGAELFFVDVSNPSLPSVKSTLEIGGDVNRIKILHNRAYLATSNSAKEFMVVNISNPNAPVVTASVNLSGSNAGLGLFVNNQDARAYITRAAAAGTSPEVSIYSVVNPDAPTVLGTMEYGSDMLAAFAADTLLFLGSANSNLEFQIYDITNPASMTYYSGLNFPQMANDMVFQNNVIYVAVRSNDALRIITSQ